MFNCIFFFFAEPEGSPLITGLKALNSTSIQVNWTPVLESLTNGIIIRYNISYSYMGEENEKPEYKSIPAPAEWAIITGLRQKARYSFKIRAATSEGGGPFSNATVTETEGKGSDCVCCDLQVNKLGISKSLFL